MKVLFVTDDCFRKIGGGTYIRAMIKTFEKIVGENNMYIFYPYETNENDYYGLNNVIMFPGKPPGFLTKLYRLVRFMPGSLSPKHIKYINNLIGEKNFDCVVVGRSYYGKAVRAIKRLYPQIRIMTIFHDIVNELIKQKIQNESIFYLFRIIPGWLRNYVNEHIGLKYSDINIVLNHREESTFKYYYNKTPDAVIPIFCSDRFNREYCQKSNDSKCVLLFVGAYYGPNNRGIAWFIDNVMSKLDDRYVLYIVGKDMEKIRNVLESGYSNVKVVGTVDILDEWYYKADIVVGPIFNGTGMKTKTVEALMYGKVYLGTTEALCGYRAMEDYLCNTAEDFIDKINQYWKQDGGEKFSEYCRQLYLDNYSEDIIKQKIINLLSPLEK